MATLRDVLDRAVIGARHVKEDLARAETGGNADLSNMLMVYRGDSLVCYVYPEASQNRDALLDCAWAAAIGFEADVLALVFESWRATTPINPRTGQAWGEREMQEFADHYDGVAAGVIQDCVSVAVYNRAGDMLMGMLPYRLGHRKVVWGEEAFFSSEGGILHERMSRIMSTESATQTMAQSGVTPAMFGLTFEEAQAHTDCALAKMLARLTPAPNGFPKAQVALAWLPGSVREAVIRSSIPSSSLREVRRATGAEQ